MTGRAKEAVILWDFCFNKKDFCIKNILIKKLENVLTRKVVMYIIQL